MHKFIEKERIDIIWISGERPTLKVYIQAYQVLQAPNWQYIFLSGDGELSQA